jgi:hypothetical protein
MGQYGKQAMKVSLWVNHDVYVLFILSALGQKQTCAVQQPMSALPPIATAKADIQPKAYTRATQK